MKKALLAIIFIIIVTGCATNNARSEIIVFAASSMTESLEQIKAEYEDKNPQVEIIYNFDSSGTLKRQIDEGAPCDIFISASKLGFNEIDSIDTASAVDLVENKIALVVSANNPKGITSFSDFVKKIEEKSLLISIGNADVPVGAYTIELFDYLDISMDFLEENKMVTYGSNVKEVLSQIKQGSVDCGIVYLTDAYTAGLEVIDIATENMCSRIIYPAAVLKTSDKKDEAMRYLDFLSEAEAKDIFKKNGFM